MDIDPTGLKEKRESPNDVEMTDVDSNKNRTPSTATNLPNPHVATGSTKPILIRDEVEFNRDDLDGRIKRCEERIANGYAAAAFKRKLDNLKAEKKQRADMMAQYPGKSWDVVQRLKKLKHIAAYLEDEKDPCKELQNVYAIIAAYETGQLDWKGKATYWCQGQMIYGPKLFSWEDFYALNTKEHRAGGGFWVEGIFGHENSARPFFKNRSEPGSVVGPPGAPDTFQYVNHVIRLDRSVQLNAQGRAQSAATPAITFTWNMPGFPAPPVGTGVPSVSHDMNGVEFPELELPFLDDTGASTMCIPEDDMLQMMGGDALFANAPMDHLMGYDSLRVADGSLVVIKTLALQANMYGINEFGYQGRMMRDWATIPCSVIDNTGGNQVERLNGPWFRMKLYVGSGPQNPPIIYSGPNKRSIMARDMIPVVPETARDAPRFDLPMHGTHWMTGPTNFMKTVHMDPNIRGRLP